MPTLGFGCAPWSVRCRCSAGLSDAKPLSAIGHTRNGRLVGRCDSGQAGLGLRGLREHKSGWPDQGRATLKKVRLRRTLPKNLTGNRNVPGAPDGLYNPDCYYCHYYFVVAVIIIIVIIIVLHFICTEGMPGVRGRGRMVLK